MQNTLKKIVAIVITITCAVWLVGPGTAQALTAAELQAQIDLLLAQIATLQSQLTALQGGTTTGAPAACLGITFDRNLKQGMSGNDVKCLQAFLNQSADTQVAASGVGSSGSETTYFGSLTKAAVVKFQVKYAADVLTPLGLTAGTGFVGAKTIAKLNALLGAAPVVVAVCGNAVCETGETNANCPADCPAALPTAAGLTVAVAADNPAAASIISDGSQGAAGSQALIPALKLVFSTPVGTSAKVTTLKLKRLGICTDTDIPNAYLYEGDTKLAEMTSLSSGVMTFLSSAGLFSVSGTKTITVKFDLHKDSTSGKLIGIGLASASDVVTDATAVNGTFPINGNLMTVATVADFGRLQISTTTNAATVDPGTALDAFKITVSASNQKISIYSMKFFQIGSINYSDVENPTLWQGSTQLATSTIASDGTVYFDLSASPYEIPSGASRIIALRVDVVKGSTRTIRFSLQKSTDIVAKDVNYGVSVAPDAGTIGSWSALDSVQTTVNSGNIVVSRSTDSPSGNIGLNKTNVTLAKFDAKAVGENIKLSSLVFRMDPGSSEWLDIKNGRIFIDGVQYGTTQLEVATSTEYPVTLSYTMEAGKTAVIEIRADIVGYSTNGVTALGANDTVRADLRTVTGNAQRMVSLGTFAFPSANQEGSSLTISSLALSSAKNISVGNIQTVYKVMGITIGSYVLAAGAAEGVDVSSITFSDATIGGSLATTSGSYSLGMAFTNLKLYKGTSQLAGSTTIVPNTSDPLGTTYTFNISPALSIAQGSSVTLYLKADVLASGLSWANGEATALLQAEGSGQTSYNAITETAGAQGQAITLSSAGSIGLAKDTSSPEPTMAYLGQTGVTLGIWRISQPNNIEDMKLTLISFFNATDSATSSANLKNLKLYCGADQFGSAVEALASSSVYSAYYFATFYVATDADACKIPKGGYKLLTLKGDFTSYSDSPYSTGGTIASGGDWLQFYAEFPTTMTGVSTDWLIIRGAGDYATGTNASGTAEKVYPYRTSLSMAIACNGACTSRVRATSDKVANLTFTGTSQADAQFRASLQADDETVNYVYYATDTGSAGTVGGHAASSTADWVIDGTYSIYFYATASAATTTFVVMDIGQGSQPDLTGYSKVSMWIRPASSTGLAYDVIVASTTDIGFDDNSGGGIQASSSLADLLGATIQADAWNYVTMNLSGLTATARYVGLAVHLENDSGNPIYPYVYIDNVRFYNDSISIDITGNTTDTATTTAFYLKTTGGTTKATGYLASPNLLTLIPDVTIEISNTPYTLELITNTQTLMKPTNELDPAAIVGFGLKIDLGTADSAADVRWYDQAVAVPAPITWVPGATPISINPTYSQ